MKTLEKRLIDYLESITGTRPDPQRCAARRSSGLPLFLRERYGLRSLRIFGRKTRLALEAPGWEAGSPAEYASHAQTLQDKLGEPVAIVIPKIPSYARNRMVQAGVPFIVPGSQLFLPSMMVDLRERFSSSAPSPGKRLAPASQCILIFHLLKESVEGVPLREIAKKVGYSPMNLSRAKDEIEAAGLCKTGRYGRSVVLEFQDRAFDLWGKALPLLSSPVKKSHWVAWPEVSSLAVRAGLTALSYYSMIEDDRIPAYALPLESYRQNLEKGFFLGCPDPSEANVQLETWSYNPLLLATDNSVVDPLSLILSLRDSADERVQQQLEILINQVEWA